MRKLVLFMHISLDGYATDDKGTINWLRHDEEMFSYAGERTAMSDTALYGRGTFRIMEAYWPTAADQENPTPHDLEHSAWYKKVEKIVVSNTLKESGPGTRIISGNPVPAIRELKEQKGKDIIMFGSPTLANTLINEQLIDDYWLFVNPILLGKGTPLFTDLQNRISLRLVFTKSFASGVVCIHYETSRDASLQT